jgi:long-chain acyl-CoA synthetase
MGSRPWLALYSPWVPEELAMPRLSMIDLFERTAAARPGLPAIHYFDDSITFGQLDDWANRYATWLRRHGIGKGDRVAIVTQNDPEFLVAQLGAWKRGAIAVPLNPMFKAKELDYHLQDSGARALVALAAYRAEYRDVIAASPVEHVLTTHDGGDFFSTLCAEAPDPDARVAAGPEDIAQLVYTSGTTGSPKGAIGLHRNIVFNAEVFRQWMRIDGDRDVILGAAPLFHITGLVAGIALCFLTGAPLVLYHRFDTATTLRMVELWRASFCVAAITAYIALMNDPRAGAADFSSMTKCYSGGAPVAPGIVDQFQAKLGARIHNIYGLTESNSPSHATPLGAQGPVDPASGALAIGVPIPNLDARIVGLADPSHELAPGEPGELAMRGPMMFPGYWNKPEATAAAFHDGWFLTGDVAVMDAQGWFYIVDRKKDMIVASGFKVWPRDVEDVLYQHAGVRECAVVGVPDPYRGETVKAFVALKQGHAATGEEIIAFCRERLAAYKYPRLVEFVPEIPKTATGKFLRRALR